jgi:hypothetical protein
MSSGNGILAVNVCLLPPKKIEAIAVEASRTLCLGQEENPELGYQLGGDDRPPFAHITLTQLFVRESELHSLVEAVENAVKSWAEQRKAHSAEQESDKSNERHDSIFSIDFVSDWHPGPVFARTPATGAVHLPSIPVARGDTIDTLHEDVSKAVQPWRLTPASGLASSSPTEPQCRTIPEGINLSETFSSDWIGNPASVEWVLQYPHRSSGLGYFPHITLGALPEKELVRFKRFSDERKSNQMSSSQSVEIHPEVIHSQNFFGAETVRLREDKCIVVISQMGNYCSCMKVLPPIAAPLS